MIDESKILQHGESSDFALASIFAPSMYSTLRVTKLRSASSTINWVNTLFSSSLTRLWKQLMVMKLGFSYPINPMKWVSWRSDYTGTFHWT